MTRSRNMVKTTFSAEIERAITAVNRLPRDNKAVDSACVSVAALGIVATRAVTPRDMREAISRTMADVALCGDKAAPVLSILESARSLSQSDALGHEVGD